LVLNQRGGRLSVRGAHDIVPRIAAAAGLDDTTAVHVLWHAFVTTRVRVGTDLVIVADLVGGARLETAGGYIRPSVGDRTRALGLLIVDGLPRSRAIGAGGASGTGDQRDPEQDEERGGADVVACPAPERAAEALAEHPVDE